LSDFPSLQSAVPANPSWAWRLPQALSVLRSCPEEWIDRRQIEELFGCSKTVAWRILRQAGVEPGPGSALLCRREDLIARLERIAAGGGSVELEIARRERLDQMLERIRPDVIANMRKVAHDDQALALVNTRFQKLPPNVQLTPTSLHIEFHGTEDFLQAFGAVVYALNNDLEAVQQHIEHPAGQKLDN
jgi:hypothetical protein